jgi:hypothetical protein
MRCRDWRSCSVAAALLVIQVGVSALGTIGLCVDRPHTHGGIPAPDCLMHQMQPGETAPPASPHAHHQHGNSTPANGARLACSCSLDPLTLFTSEIAVIPHSLSIALPSLSALSSPPHAQRPPEARLAPLAPPPKPTLS